MLLVVVLEQATTYKYLETVWWFTLCMRCSDGLCTGLSHYEHKDKLFLRF
jgi:hypothetical protein